MGVGLQREDHTVWAGERLLSQRDQGSDIECLSLHSCMAVKFLSPSSYLQNGDDERTDLRGCKEN